MRKTLIREIAEIYDRNLRKRNGLTKVDAIAMAEVYERQREIDKNFFKKVKNL